MAEYAYLSDGMKTGAFKADGSGFIYSKMQSFWAGIWVILFDLE